MKFITEKLSKFVVPFLSNYLAVLTLPLCYNEGSTALSRKGKNRAFIYSSSALQKGKQERHFHKHILHLFCPITDNIPQSTDALQKAL